eukprot:844469-Pelagomonas_calceolata.AAC.3
MPAKDVREAVALWLLDVPGMPMCSIRLHKPKTSGKQSEGGREKNKLAINVGDVSVEHANKQNNTSEDARPWISIQLNVPSASHFACAIPHRQESWQKCKLAEKSMLVQATEQKRHL